MINLENIFDIVNYISTILMNNPLFMFVLSCFTISSFIKLFFKVFSINPKDDENIIYSEEYKNNECEKDDDRFNYGFFKK